MDKANPDFWVAVVTAGPVLTLAQLVLVERLLRVLPDERPLRGMPARERMRLSRERPLVRDEVYAVIGCVVGGFGMVSAGVASVTAIDELRREAADTVRQFWVEVFIAVSFGTLLVATAIAVAVRAGEPPK